MEQRDIEPLAQAIAAASRESVSEALIEITDRIVAALAANQDEVVRALDRRTDVIERFERGVTNL